MTLTTTTALEKSKSDLYFEWSDTVLLVLDADLRVVEINPKGCQLLHAEAQDIVGQPWIERFIPPSHQAQVGTLLQKILQADGAPDVYLETPLNRGQMEDVIIAWHHGQVLKIPDKGRLLLLAGRDISPAVQLMQSKEIFVATLSHDLNPPLLAAAQVLTLMLEEKFGPLTPEQAEVLGEMQHSNQFMRHMVESLVTLYKYEDNQITLNRQITDLNRLITEIVERNAVSQIKAKKQHLTLTLDPTLAPVYVDPDKIRTVLINLIENASLFSPEEAHIEITSGMGHGQVQVTVIDNGQGIDEETLKSLFNRYNTIAKRFRKVGTGLSLYLSKKIIEAHGGTIGAHSTVGKGSTFFFTLSPPESRGVQP